MVENEDQKIYTMAIEMAIDQDHDNLAGELWAYLNKDARKGLGFRRLNKLLDQLIWLDDDFTWKDTIESIEQTIRDVVEEENG